MVEHKTFSSLVDALKAAGYGVLYVYVSPSLEQGWITKSPLLPLQWNEKLVLVDQQESRGFLREVGSDARFALVALGHGFIIARANDSEDLERKLPIIRQYVAPINDLMVKRGLVNPKADNGSNS